MSPEIDDEARLRAAINAGEVEQKLSGWGVSQMLLSLEAARFRWPCPHDPLPELATRDLVDRLYDKHLREKQSWRAGVLFRWGSCWIGYHWSKTNKRLCVNLIPFVTVWVCPPGGITP